MVSSPPTSLSRKTQRSTPKAKRKNKKQQRSKTMEIWSDLLHKVDYISEKRLFLCIEKVKQ